MNDILPTLIEVELKNPEDFLKIKETLTRIGVASHKEKKLSQSCHILHKQGKYYIVHFLEMFMLDGKGKNFTEEDRNRRNMIALLLEEWGLLKIKNHVISDPDKMSMKNIKIVPFAEKKDWVLTEKYSIGGRK
jgi:hypothetical protein